MTLGIATLSITYMQYQVPNYILSVVMLSAVLLNVVAPLSELVGVERSRICDERKMVSKKKKFFFFQKNDFPKWFTPFREEEGDGVEINAPTFANFSCPT
jgi:hypothetical protein